jgi:hypothetical protein
MRTVQKDRQTTFGLCFNDIALCSSSFLEPRGNSTQPVTHRGVMGLVAGEETSHQPRGLAK